MLRAVRSQRYIFRVHDEPVFNTGLRLDMRTMWSQMSSQNKKAYYKRVIDIYKRPERAVTIASTSIAAMRGELVVPKLTGVFH
jgi:hypothetical protein